MAQKLSCPGAEHEALEWDFPIANAAMITEKYDFNFEKASRFRAGLQDVLDA